MTFTLAAIAIILMLWAIRSLCVARRTDETHRNILALLAEQVQDDEARKDERAIADNLDV